MPPAKEEMKKPVYQLINQAIVDACTIGGDWVCASNLFSRHHFKPHLLLPNQALVEMIPPTWASGVSTKISSFTLPLGAIFLSLILDCSLLVWM